MSGCAAKKVHFDVHQVISFHFEVLKEQMFQKNTNNANEKKTQFALKT